MRKRRIRKRTLRTIVKTILYIMLIAIIAGVGFGVFSIVKFVKGKYDKLTITDIDRDKITIDSEIYDNNTSLKGYTNYLLLGSDKRKYVEGVSEDEGAGNTDSIIICSVNNDTNEIKLVSVYRDTLMKTTDIKDGSDKYKKATEIYGYAGVEATISAINTSLDLDIKDYVLVNFEGLIRVVDAVGGIDIEINDQECYWLNQYLVDTGKNTDMTYETVPQAGMVHLNGIQATAYCRIRYDENLDYGRAQRQRRVIELVLQKAQTMGLSQLNAAVDGVLDNLETSIPVSELLSLLKDVKKYSIAEQAGFPFEKYSSIKYVKELDIYDPVFPVNLSANVTELHKFLFGVDDYDTTDKLDKLSAYYDRLLEDSKKIPGNVYE